MALPTLAGRHGKPPFPNEGPTLDIHYVANIQWLLNQNCTGRGWQDRAVALLRAVELHLAP